MINSVKNDLAAATAQPGIKFVAHNYINNNLYVFQNFKSPLRGRPRQPGVSLMDMVTHPGVMLTEQGLCVLFLDKSLDEPDKIVFARLLNEKLEQKFGYGFSAATVSNSDCAERGVYEPFFKGIKDISPSIKTILVGDAQPGISDIVIEDMSADFVHILSAELGITDRNKAEPKDGWIKLGKELSELYKTAEQEIEARTVPSFPAYVP